MEASARTSAVRPALRQRGTTSRPVLAAIVELVLERQGITRWRDGESASCTAFRPTAADVRRFFRLAGEAEAGEVHMTLPESRCAAEGRVRFADGGTGRWQIKLYGLGWLDRPGRARVTLYCRRCRSRPWRQ